MPLFNWTGNPWVDAGIAALCVLQEKDTPDALTLDDCKKAADFIKMLYPKWAVKGHGFVKIFHNLPAFNTSVEQPDNLKEELIKLKEKLASELNINLKIVSKTKQFKEQSKELRKRHVTNDYKLSVFERRYAEFIDDMVTKLETVGSGHTCIATGQHEANILLQRDKYPLLGSGDMVNYFSFFEEGLRFSYNATFAVQFAPLAILEVSDEVKKITTGKRKKKGNEDVDTKKKKQTKLFLAHSHDERIFMNETVGILSNSIKHFKKALSQNAEIGFYSPPIKTRNLSEGAVRLAEYFIGNSDELISDTGIAIRLYSFSNAGQYANVSFVDLPASIYRFISKARRFAYFNNLKDFFLSLQWNEYEKFVEGESITYKFFDRENNRLRTDWKLFELYLTEVEEMPHQDLQTIIYAGTQFYRHIKTINQKPLKELEQIGKGKFGEYKRLLLSVHKQTPLCTTEQFQILAPDVESEEIKNWLLVRDLILFRVYECQHNEQLAAEKILLPQIDSKLYPRLQVQIRVADRIFEYCIMQNHRSRLKEFESVEKGFQDFFTVLVALQREYFICSTEELEILFPRTEDGQVLWKDTKNTIMFRIYECVHKTNLQSNHKKEVL